MAYSADSFSAGEQPTTAKWNKLWTNDASFNDGTGIANMSTSTTAISNPYKFSAYRSGSQTISASTLTKVQLNAEDFDTNNNFDSATNYRYTAPVTGFYQINARVANNGNGAIFLTIYKNGSEFRDGGLTTIATGRSAIVYSDLLSLTAADYLELWVYSDNTTVTGTNAYDTARFSGILLSRT